MATPTYELIETTTLSSSASSVTFSSITQDYRDLVLVIAGNLGTSGSVVCQVNGNSNNDYSYIFMEGSGGSPFTSSSTSSNSLRLAQGISSIGGLVTAHFIDYSVSGKHRSVISRGTDSSSQTGTYVNRFASTGAITTLEIQNNSSSFQSGATFTLFGIAG